MRLITRKSEVKEELIYCFEAKTVSDFISEFHARLLNAKVKFPLLEFCGEEIYNRFPKKKHIDICNRIADLKTEGGNVILGTVLRLRLSNDFNESMEKAREYISAGNEWYVSDIIGERVFGNGLLNHPNETLTYLTKLSKEKPGWVTRSVGAGIHLATKWGLPEISVEKAFKILLSLGNTKDYETKRGIGWAAKTIAKFHPKIIEKYRSEINNTGQWFNTKVKIGLERGEYARNKS